MKYSKRHAVRHCIFVTIRNFAVGAAVFGSFLLAGQSSRADDSSELLIEWAINPYKSFLQNVGVVRWPTLPSVTIYFLANATQQEREIARSEVESIQKLCGCISYVTIADPGARIELSKNDILVLIDQGGFQGFLRSAPKEVKEILGTPRLAGSFPEHAKGSGVNFNAIFVDSTTSNAVAATFYNGRSGALRTILINAVLAGLNPGVGMSQELYLTIVEKTASAEGNVYRPISQYSDFLRHLYNPKVKPGMTPDEVRSIRW